MFEQPKRGNSKKNKKSVKTGGTGSTTQQITRILTEEQIPIEKSTLEKILRESCDNRRWTTRELYELIKICDNVEELDYVSEERRKKEQEKYEKPVQELLNHFGNQSLGIIGSSFVELGWISKGGFLTPVICQRRFAKARPSITVLLDFLNHPELEPVRDVLGSFVNALERESLGLLYLGIRPTPQGFEILLDGAEATLNGEIGYLTCDQYVYVNTETGFELIEEKPASTRELRRFIAGGEPVCNIFFLVKKGTTGEGTNYIHIKMYICKPTP